MKAVIICNGEFPRKEFPRFLIRGADLRVCCDAGNGLKGLLRMGLVPDVIVGDMDSAPESFLKSFGGRIVRVDEQDDNDLAKAFAWLRENHPEADEINIVGASGRSEAHSLGNLAWLMEWEKRHGLAARGIRVQMVSDYNVAFAISGTTQLHVGEGRKVSVFSADPAVRIKSSGLQWPTGGVVFDAWWKGSLNRAYADVITLSPSGGAPVLVILD